MDTLRSGATHTHALLTRRTSLSIPKLDSSPSVTVDVGGEDGGVHLPAGRGREDGTVSDALRYHQPPVAAASGDHPFHQPAEGKGSQRGHGGSCGHAPALAVWVRGMESDTQGQCHNIVAGCWFSSPLVQPRSLIANLLAGPSTLGSVHFARDSSLTNHAAAGIGDGTSALRSLSPVSSNHHLRGSLSAAHRAAAHTSATSRAMACSG